MTATDTKEHTMKNLGRTHRRLRAVALLSAAALLVSCGGANDSSSGSNGTTPGGAPAVNLPSCPLDALAKAGSPVEVVAWHTQNAKPGDTLTQLVEKYNASQSKVKVRLESQGSSYEELNRKFTSAVQSKQLPGLIMVDDTSTQLMADSGVILPAQSCLNAAKQDTSPYVKVAVDYYTIDGVLWPASAGLGSILFWYNKDHFKRAGLDPEKPPTTLAELRADAEKIKAAGIVEHPFVHEMASWKTEFWLTGAHSPVVNHDNGRSGQATNGALTDNPKAAELYTWFKQMNDDGLLEPIAATEGQINQYLAIASRKSSMLIESSSAATSIEAFLGGKLDPSVVGGANPDVSGLDLGAGVVPGIDGPGKTQMGGAAWYITNTTAPEVQAAAWDFMSYMNGDEAQAAMLTGGSYLPYRKSAAETSQAKTFFSSSMAGKWLAVANGEVQQIDPSFPGPLIGPYPEARLAIRDSMENMIFKGATPADTLAAAQKELDAALKRYADEGF
jgi:sn-glycerol 3-phosphate transport system substrate-binding protein